MPKVIIGIHGLANKPEEGKLYEWWLRAINDGMKVVDGPAVPPEQFRLAYWADLMYADYDPRPEPYTDPETDEIDDDRSKIVAIGREYFAGIVGKFGDLKVNLTDDQRIEGIKNAVRRKIVVDLADYYDDQSRIKFSDRTGTQTRQAIRSVLQELIEQHSADQLLVIAHSMGSIIAYDVLRGLADSSVSISDLITIGSPLGLSVVKKKIQEEWDNKDGPYVPEILTEGWRNYADPKDLVSVDLSLEDEYVAYGGIGVEDVIVSNGYCCDDNGEKKHNHHKSYGYLRTPELAMQVRDFLSA